MNEIKTANGSIIPFIGMGTFPLQGRKMADTVKSAVKIGYRLIDTADDYRGEDGIGLAIDELIKDGFCKREDLFLQTKISANGAYHDEPLAGLFFNPRSRFMQRHSVEEIVREKVATSLMGMNTDYIDSLLIHLPYPGYIEEIWDVMIKLKNEGLVRHIGVSNFHKRHIDAIANSGVLPEFNQIYICPICTKQKQLEYYKAQGIQLMTYSPLMDLASNRIPVDNLRVLMEKYNKTAAQLILRWNIERGCLPLPRTKSIERLVENFNVFDFSLTEEEVGVISALNIDYQYMPESLICPGL